MKLNGNNKNKQQQRNVTNLRLHLCASCRIVYIFWLSQISGHLKMKLYTHKWKETVI